MKRHVNKVHMFCIALLVYENNIKNFSLKYVGYWINSDSPLQQRHIWMCFVKSGVYLNDAIAVTGCCFIYDMHMHIAYAEPNVYVYYMCGIWMT